ncbi:MAG: hypothetical protein NZ901_00140 [Geminocystis sp.]|nr:hypothetical protein [Geminocystis sp.]MCX8077525.1 hypothetical protein [Geminocystis sp.]MDW8115402.1 hypothetical protein [Geminocystis sp.]HIK37620.1 hypothetical protein [Geminocystis sp. M7585_C2015_104]
MKPIAGEEDQLWLEEETEESPPSEKKKGSIVRLYLNIIKRKWPIVLTFTLLGLGGAVYWASKDPITYRGSFEMIVEPATSVEKLTDPTIITRSGGNVDERLLAIDYPTVLKILKTGKILEDVAERVHRQLPEGKYFAEEIRKKLEENLSVERVQLGKSRFDVTKVIGVSFKDEDPQLVETVLQALADRYLEYSREEREKNLRSGIKFIEQQLQRIHGRLESLQNQQIELQNKYLGVNPQTKGDALFQTSLQYQQEINNLDTELRALKALAANLEKNLGLTARESFIAYTLSQEPKIQKLQSDIQQLESQIALESARLNSKHPTVTALKAQKNELARLLYRETTRVLRENKITEKVNPRVFAFQDNNRLQLIQKLIETQNQIDTLTARRQSLLNKQKEIAGYLKDIPEVIKQYNELDRQIQLQKELFNQLSRQKETLSVELAQTKNPWEILSTVDGNLIANPPDPKKKLIAGTGLGITLGLLLAIAIEKKQDVIMEASDLEYAFGLPVLGTIRFGGGKGKSLVSLEEESSFLELTSTITQKVTQKNTETPSELTEVFANFHFQLTSDRPCSVLITSLHPSDGQAYIVANLAKTVAKLDQKVLVIEANTLFPEMQEHFGEKYCVPLQDLILAADSNVPPQKLLPEDKKIVVITSEATEEEEDTKYLSAKSVQSVIEEIKKGYYLTLYNSSFFLESHQASLLAENTDGIIMAVTLKSTPFSQVQKAVQRIEKYNLNFLGFVVMS